MRRFWIGLLAAILLPYVVTLAWSGNIGGAGRGSSENRVTDSGRKVYLDNGQNGYVDVETYLVGVVARQISGEYELEAVKAQAVIARTYIYGKMDGRQEIRESELGVEVFGEMQMEDAWGKGKFLEYYEKMKRAVAETAGVVMVLDIGSSGTGVMTDAGEGASGGEGKSGDESMPILPDPLFHQVSAGYTRTGGVGYEYLESVESPADLEAEGYLTVREWQPAEIVQLLSGETTLTEGQVLETIQLVSREESGYVKQIQIGSHIFTGDEVRTLLGLPSAAFTLGEHEGNVRAVCRGIGHGYGLSQYGAHRMAQEGETMEEILKYYYQNIAIISSPS